MSNKTTKLVHLNSTFLLGRLLIKKSSGNFFEVNNITFIEGNFRDEELAKFRTFHGKVAQCLNFWHRNFEEESRSDRH